MYFEKMREIAHYDEAAVLSAIAPHTSYKNYVKSIHWDEVGKVVVEFGPLSGRLAKKEDVFVSYLGGRSTFLARADILSIRHEVAAPADMIEGILTGYKKAYIFVHDGNDGEPNGMVYDVNDLVITAQNTIALRQNCELLDPDYYGEAAYALERHTIYIDGCREHILCTEALHTVHGYAMHRDDKAAAYNPHHDYFVDTNNQHTVYNVDYDEYALESDSYYHDEYYYRDNPLSDKEIIHDYHSGPPPEIYTKEDDSRLSRWTIGFEIEKNSVGGECEPGKQVANEPLFAHWEADASCGVEGVTHVYGLNMAEKFYVDVEDSHLVDEPSDVTCGGHINLAHRDDLIDVWHVKPWLGLMWSMYRKRLRRDYCSRNPKANPYQCRESHYGALVEKTCNTGKLFELRVPRRVRNRRVLLRRFEFMQKLVACIDAYAMEEFNYIQKKYTDDVTRGQPAWLPPAATTVDWSALSEVPVQSYRRMRYLIELSKPQLLECYEDNPVGLTEAIFYAYFFQAYIDLPRASADITRDIATFID